MISAAFGGEGGEIPDPPVRPPADRDLAFESLQIARTEVYFGWNLNLSA
jgi:hypothetical protein